MSKTKSPIKQYESYFLKYFTRNVYAALADIETGWNGSIKHSPYYHQNYANLMKEKPVRADGLKARFTVNEQAQQCFTLLFQAMIAELRNIEAEPTDTLAEIIEKLVNANAECYTEFMFAMAAKYRPDIGKTLMSAVDTTQWLNGKFITALVPYTTMPIVMATLLNEFDGFIKAIAWLFSLDVWYDELSFTAGRFQALLTQHHMNQIMIDTLASNLREKPPPKPRVKKVATTVVTGEIPLVSTIDNTEMTTTECDQALEHTVNPPISDLDDMLSKL